MPARAVLIGSPTYGLRGCRADVELIAALLERRGYDDVVQLHDGDAARAGVLAALEELIGATRPGDSAFVYFSGHGGRLLRPDAEQRRAAGNPVYFQFIVPTDMDDSAPGDFRGILSEELTVLQRRLADAAGAPGPIDVTTVLDCCHAGYMARSSAAVARSVDFESRMFKIAGIRDHAAGLAADAALAGSSNPHVVRLVACQPEQSAYERPSPRAELGGEVHGVFTETLAGVLDALGEARLSWEAVGDLVRRRVRAQVPEQRPEVEGPADRVAFAAIVDQGPRPLPLAVRDGSLVVPAGSLLGAGVGAEVELLGAGATGPGIAARVVGLDGVDAVLDLGSEHVGAAIEDAVAIVRRLSVPPIVVVVEPDPGTGSGVDRALVRQALAGVPGIVESGDAANGDAGGDAGGDATIRLVPGSGWELADEDRAAWRRPPFEADVAGVAAAVAELERIAAGRRLLDLASGSGDSALAPQVEVVWGTITDGVRRPLAPHGERVRIGERVYLTLRNRADSARFGWVFDVGVSGRASLVTHAASSGVRLGPSDDDDDTFDVWQAAGEPLGWPDDVPPLAAGRRETFVVITADARHDLSALASRPPVARGNRSALDLVLDEVRVGSRAADPAAGGSGLRYRVDLIEFVVVAQ